MSDAEDTQQAFTTAALADAERIGGPWQGFVWMQSASRQGSSHALVMLHNDEAFTVEPEHQGEAAVMAGLQFLDALNRDSADQAALVAQFTRSTGEWDLVTHFGDEAGPWVRNLHNALADERSINRG